LVSGLVAALLLHDEHQQFFFGELRHRSRNLFMIVQGIVSRTLCPSATILKVGCWLFQIAECRASWPLPGLRGRRARLRPSRLLKTDTRGVGIEVSDLEALSRASNSATSFSPRITSVDRVKSFRFRMGDVTTTVRSPSITSNLAGWRELEAAPWAPFYCFDHPSHHRLRMGFAESPDFAP
jgi:hypothetical protein